MEADKIFKDSFTTKFIRWN